MYSRRPLNAFDGWRGSLVVECHRLLQRWHVLPSEAERSPNCRVGGSLPLLMENWIFRGLGSGTGLLIGKQIAR